MTQYILLYYWRFDDKQVIFEETTNVVSLIEKADEDIKLWPGIEKVEIYENYSGVGLKQYFIKRVAEHEFKRWYNVGVKPNEEGK